MTAHRRARTDRGVTIVEAALVLPLFLLLVLGLVDFGFGIFQDSQATSAARDGARRGILDPTDTAAIEAEARARTVGRSGVDVTVVCLDGLEGSTPVAGGCAQATPGEDRIRVTVAWDYDSPTGVGQAFVGSRRISGTSTMVIVGRPVSITPPTPAPPADPDDGSDGEAPEPPVPGACEAEQVVSTQVPVKLKNGKYPDGKATWTVTTNGAATCTELQIAFPTSSGYEVRDLDNVSPPHTFAVTLNPNTYRHTAGTYELRVLDRSGDVIGTFAMHITGS